MIKKKETKDEEIVQHYSLEPIKKRKCRYNMIFGERSNGKTYAVLKEGIDLYLENHTCLGIIRRWDEDLRASKGSEMFNNFIYNEETGNYIEKKTCGKWNNVKYISRKWYLVHQNEDGEIDNVDPNPMAYAFALTQAEHYKSQSFPLIRTILFDEFITRDNYLIDEFIEFMNVLSTIIRNRDDVTIYMCGNTVNKYSPYFAEMGITRVRKMQKGDIDVYQYGEEGKLRVAVEYSDFPSKKKKSDVYFAFDNPKLQMITKGEWEIQSYPHRPIPFEKYDIIYTYFIKFEEDILQCEVVEKNDMMFTFIHRKTTPIKDNPENIVYQQDYDPRPNYRRRINRPQSELEQKIASFYSREKVFYQSNDVGEIVRNYLLWCNNQKL